MPAKAGIQAEEASLDSRLRGNDTADAERFATELAQALGLSPDYVLPAYEDPWRIIHDEANLPLNVDPLTSDTSTEPARRRLGDRIAAGLGNAAGYVLPLKSVPRNKPANQTKWQGSPWPLRGRPSSRSCRLVLITRSSS